MQYNTHDDSFGPAKSTRAPAGAAMPIKTQVGEGYTVDYGPNGEMKQSASSGISPRPAKLHLPIKASLQQRAQLRMVL